MINPLPLVSILTLNYNSSLVTCEFLESCKGLTYTNLEILVCDMHSDDDLSKVINYETYPNVKLHISTKNRGFAGGNNWGMDFASGEYILIINNDTEVTPDLIEKLLLPFQIDQQAGVVCPKIKYHFDKNRIQYAGFKKMNRYTGRTKALGSYESDFGQFDEIRTTWGAHGAAMMVKREVIERVGRFPEKFFLYYEEWDWATRILNSGYKIYFQGMATVYHKESMSVGKTSPLKEYYLTRNRILYMRRNSNAFRFAFFVFFFLIFTFPKTIFRHLLKRDFAYLKAFLKGIGDNFVMSSYSPI